MSSEFMPRYDPSWLLNSGAGFLDVYSNAFLLTHPTFSLYGVDDLAAWTAETPAIRGHLLVKQITLSDPTAVDWLSAQFGAELTRQLEATQTVVVFANLGQVSVAALVVVDGKVLLFGPRLSKLAKSVSLDQFTEMDLGQVFEVTHELLDTVVSQLDAIHMLDHEGHADEENMQTDFDEALQRIDWLLKLEDLV
jgi:hypothetical protein